MHLVVQSKGHSLGAARRPALVAYLVALVLALFSGRAAIAAASLAEAAAIRDECAAAKASLQSAWTLAANPSSTEYRTALRDGEAHADEAYSRATAAVWPAELSAQRTSVITAIS